MSTRVAEAALGGALRRWRWLRFGTGLAWVVGAVSLSALAWGAAIWRGWITDTVVAAVVALLVALGGGAGLLAVLLVSVLARRPRAWLAERVEDAEPSLLDRLNTLVWLEGRSEPELDGFRKRIERQVARACAYVGPAAISSRTRNLSWLAALLVVAGATTFLVRVRPWTRLASPLERAEGGAGEAESRLALPPPDETAAEVKRTWGEVRITEPGHDLKVTKVDVVPLQIEAAATDALERAHWVTAVGGTSATHALGAPTDPHYAVYKPLLYVDELRLSDWDVVAYHAAAATAQGSYASDVHFLEVRPFREDILKLPGGESGDAYQLLGELSGLIDRQKHVVRETHQFEQRTYTNDALRRQDRDKLAAAERDLAEAARHLYARIAARLENADVGVVLDNLALAGEHLRAAAAALEAGNPRAAEHERAALTALVATRKHLQKAITDNPGAFGAGDAEEQTPPLAGLEERLAKIAEFRDAGAAARKLLEEAVARQKQIAADAAREPADRHPELGRKQDDLRRELSEFAKSNPELFRGAESQGKAAGEAMQKSARALSGGDPSAAAATRGALDAVERLRDAVGRSTDARELGQAYELKRAIDDQARQLEGVEKQPEARSAEELEALAEQSKRTVRELDRLVHETPAGGAFGPPLHDAMAPRKQAELERRLDALPQSPESAARRAAAASARAGLEQLGDAFERSEPKVVRELRRSDPLGEGGGEAFDRALRALEGLLGRAVEGKPLTGEDARRQRREILLALERGARERYGRDPRAMLLVKRAQEELTRVDLRVDAAKLRRLMDEIEQFRAENAEERAAKGDPELRHVDVSRLPPAYRERIQRYYRRLSEER